MNKKRSLSINAFLNGLRNFLNLLFPLITFPYVSRVLTVDGVGIYNFSNTYVGYFLLIAGLGITTYAIREGAKYRDKKVAFEMFSSQVFSINMISTVVAYLLLFLSLLFFRRLEEYSICILIFSVQILFTTIGTEWIYTIYEDFSYITVRSILFKVISIILLFLLVKKSTDYYWYAGITVFASVGSNILNYVHLRKFVRLKLTSKVNWRKHLRPILIIFASQLAVSIYVYSDNTILGLLKNDYAVGIYSISVKIYTIAQGLLTSVLAVTIPRLAMLYGKSLFKKYNNLLNNLINTLLVLSIPATIGLMMLSKDIVIIIANEKYLPSVTSLQIISFAILFSILSWIFSECILIPAKRENYVLRNTVITACFNVLINLLFIPLWTYNGTALSTVLSELLSAVMNAYYSRDILLKAKTYRNVGKTFLDIIFGCIGIGITCMLVSMIISNIVLQLIISVIASILVYGFILIVARNKEISVLLDRFRKRW
ncbi:flippase [Lentilactobacillus hilgardii]|uniref:flippase n=1 Tax=Lentilactobacillus hilgardii TaxID=1588 RepID=UPI0021A3015E|nr:flippase [Lentilactobacillus hilgardii]MCT3395875.1 flippase [Lentilactobacillus hilgardii]